MTTVKSADFNYLLIGILMLLGLNLSTISCQGTPETSPPILPEASPAGLSEVFEFPLNASRDSRNPANPEWAGYLYEQLSDIDNNFDGELGVFIKDLDSGNTVSFRGDENWYLASGIKIPVAIAVLQAVESGELSLDEKLQLKATDYVDGAGQTNWSSPGSLFTIRHLFNEMIQVSDNTASDILIRLVGIDKVNSFVYDIIPGSFGDITTLADVRRYAYSGFHEKAHSLSGYDFIRIRQQTEEQKRMETIADLMDIETQDFMMPDMDTAFEAYYASNLNAGQLSAFGALLELLTTGQLLDSEQTEYLLDVMRKVKTGGNRIKAGLPESTLFAHKTGTQRGRTCDLGVASGTGEGGVVIAACTRGTLNTSLAEKALRSVGEAVQASGLLDPVTLSEN